MPPRKQSAPAADAAQIYQLKITLRYTKPPIWRKVQVLPTITLAKLHDVIQYVMGWDDSHLHEFNGGGLSYGPPFEGVGWGEGPDEDERKTRLNQLLDAPKKKLRYLYDFGDSWEHEIVLEKILPAEPGVRYPLCIEGKLATPPDDVGGIPGFYNMLEIIADPTDPEYKDMVEWLGYWDEHEDEEAGEREAASKIDPKAIFDPEAFDIEAANRRLKLVR